MNWRCKVLLFIAVLFSCFVCTESYASAQSTPSITTSNSLSAPGGLSTSKTVSVPLVGSNASNGGGLRNDKAVSDSDSDGITSTSPASTTSTARSTSSTSTHAITSNRKPQALPTQAPTKSHSRTVTGQATHFTFHPHPVSSTLASTDPSETARASSTHRQSPTAIAFEVIGGLAAFSVLLCCGRCMYKYRRMPARDRISAIVDRHFLERELAEMEEAQEHRRRTSLLVPPPPPYQRAPEYGALSPTDDGQNSEPHSARSPTSAEPLRPP